MNKKKNTINLILSAFLVIAFIVCTYFFSTLNQTSTVQNALTTLTVVFGLILFYATRVGDGKPVKRFSVVTLIIMVLPSLYILLTSLAPTLPLGDTLGNSLIVVCLAGVALGYGIPYTFLSGFEVEREEVEEGNVEGGIMEEIDATDENETDETEELEQNEEVTEDDTPVEDNQE